MTTPIPNAVASLQESVLVKEARRLLEIESDINFRARCFLACIYGSAKYYVENGGGSIDQVELFEAIGIVLPQFAAEADALLKARGV